MARRQGQDSETDTYNDVCHGETASQQSCPADIFDSLTACLLRLKLESEQWKVMKSHQICRCRFSTKQTFGVALTDSETSQTSDVEMVWNGHPQVVATISDISDASMLVAYIPQISISSWKSHNIMMTIYPSQFWWLCFECWLFFGLFLRSTKGCRPLPRNHREEQWNQMTSGAREEDKPVNHSKPMFNHVQSEQSAAGWWPHQSLLVTPMHQILQLGFLTGRLEIECL